jgi:hypothetical protein
MCEMFGRASCELASFHQLGLFRRAIDELFILFLYSLRSTFSHCFHWLVGNLSPTSISLPCILIGYHLLGGFTFSLYRLSTLPSLIALLHHHLYHFYLLRRTFRRNNTTS